MVPTKNLLAARRGKRGCRFSAVVAAFAIAIISAPAAQANVFNGPWDSAHQPASVTNPNIDVGPLDTMGTFIVLPLTGYGCPASATTTFADPSGSITETTAGVDNGFYCARTNTETRTDSPDYSVTWETIGASEFLPSVSPRSVPFLYTMSDSTGVVTQGAYTWTYGTFRINSGTSQFNTVCLDGHHTLYSGSNGVVYCLTTEGVDTPGWPTPTPPPTPPIPPAPAGAPPAPRITAHPSGAATQTAATFTFSDTQAGVAFKCRLDAGAFSDCSSPRRYQSLALGHHTFRVHAVDSLGQASGDTSYAWTVKAKYAITLSGARQWAWSAVIDQFYGGRSTTKLTAFRVRHCAQQRSGRFRCGVSWQKRPYAFSGMMTVGDVNPSTGYFNYGFKLLRRNTLSGATRRLAVAY